jgi:hypothetical protein
MNATANGTPSKNGHAAVHSRTSSHRHRREVGNLSIGPAPLPPVGDGAGTPSPGLAPHEGRNAAGRFKPGNKLGHGNPYARQQAALRRAITEALTVDKIQELTAKLFTQALSGDVQAAELLLRYGIGRPGPAPNPDALDLDEWNLIMQNPSLAQVRCAVLKLLRADLAAAAAAYAENNYQRTDPEALVNSIVGAPEPFSEIDPILDAKHKRP